MPTFFYTIDELPLVIVGGIEGAFINGSAEIRYGRDFKDWSIESVAIEGYRNLSLDQRLAGEKSWTQIKPSEEVERIIRHRLEHEWASRVDRAVSDQIDEDRECAECAADAAT